MLEVACHACWAAGGSVNHAKLQAFKVRLRLGQLHLCTGTVHTVLGPQQYKRGELSLAGIPMLMGSHPTAAIAKTLAKLRLILFGVYRLRPSYCLALRIVLHYAISKMDFVHEAVPPTSSRLTPVQRSSDAVLTAALHIPRSTPRVLLHAPLRSGGFGAPHLVTRFQLRYIQGLFKALSSRNAWSAVPLACSWHVPSILQSTTTTSLSSVNCCGCITCKSPQPHTPQPQQQQTLTTFCGSTAVRRWLSYLMAPPHNMP